MTQMDLFQTATSSQPDIRANHFHLPGSEEAQKMTDISGLSFLPLLKASDPLFAFSKMFMGMSLWGSTKCYLTWRGKATPQGRSLFQLVPRTHLTEEIDSGLSEEMWPTPTSSTGGPSKNPENPRGKHGGNPLATAVAMWPTPRVTGQENLDTLIKRKGLQKALQHNLTAAVQMWPTPRASEYKDTGPVGSKSHTHMQEKKYLCAAVKDPEQPLGMLNPQWVEWLMGYPEGWTDLED